MFDVKRFDVYRKLPKDLTQPTTTGAVISIISSCFILFLMISEGLAFMQEELISGLGRYLQYLLFYLSVFSLDRFSLNYKCFYVMSLNVKILTPCQRTLC